MSRQEKYKQTVRVREDCSEVVKTGAEFQGRHSRCVCWGDGVRVGGKNRVKSFIVAWKEAVLGKWEKLSF